MKHAAILSLVALALSIGGCKKGESAGTTGKSDECKKAFEHWAEVSAKKNGGTKEEKLTIQAGNIASCPKMMSPAGLKCLNDLTEANVSTWPTCLGK